MKRPLTKQEVEECNRAQMAEMDLHKYLESEKAGRDLGRAAHLDWARKYGKPWREDWLRRQAEKKSGGDDGSIAC